MSVSLRDTLVLGLMGASALLAGCGRVKNAAMPSASSPPPAALVAPVAPPTAAAKSDGDSPDAERQGAELISKLKTTSCSETRQVPELLALGGDALSAAISGINRAPAVDMLSHKLIYDDLNTLSHLRDARDCYTRTLQSSSNNYSALLGLGIANTMGAMIETDDQQLRSSYLQSAKRLLGRAYIVRQGPYEPIYYLAHVAMIEGRNDQATEFLNQLLKAGYRIGSVYALCAEIAARANNQAQAEDYYRKVLEVGASSDELYWALSRLATLRAKRKK